MEWDTLLELLLLSVPELPAAVPVGVAVVPAISAAFTEQKLENQVWMLARPSETVVHALSQTPDVPVLKAETSELLQKHSAYVARAAVETAGGTQAPLAS